MQHPGEHVHRILFPAGGAGGALEPLIEVLESAPGPAREQAIAALSRILAHGDIQPDALGRAILDELEALHFYRHQRDSQWRYGTFTSRKTLVDELFARAKGI